MMATELAIPFEPTDGRAEERALILAAQAGDRAAFGRLYERYARMVYGIALCYVSFDDSADLVHDVFIRAIERLPSLRAAEAFGGWLTAIARNTALDSTRRNREKTQSFDRDLQSLSARHGNRAEALAILERIRLLPDAYKETLILRLVEGLTGPEIAEQTGLTPDSVRVNLHRGMRLLRENLKDWR